MTKLLLKLSLLLLVAPVIRAQTPQHTVALTWIASTSPNVGYHVYRVTKGDTSPAVKISSAANPVAVTPCVPPVTGQVCWTLTDTTVVTGKTYGYTVTAYDLVTNNESTPTPEVDATVVTVTVIVAPTGVQVKVIQ